MKTDGLKIAEYAGEGYLRLVNGAKWTLATLNYAARFDEQNIVDLERHNVTDETFVLLQGEATLLMEDTARGRAGNVGGAPRPASIPLRRITMEPLKYYNIGAGTWHNIVVSKDARVLVAENANTSKDNTDYLEIATGRIFKKRPTFEEVLPGTYLLKVPFGPVWTGVVLVVGRTSEVGGDGSAAGAPPRRGPSSHGGALAAVSVNILIDSSQLDPERYLIPALADLGLKPTDIDWLLNTHVHGDHIGGHHALVTKYGLKTATLRKNADALRDPVKVAVRVRTRFPQNSPAPQSYLKGVEATRLLEEGELLVGRFACYATPGHDDDCQTWVDTKTGTAFTGDSLQANGTPTQGIAFYRDLSAYRGTLAKLASLNLQNIVCGHDYDGIGDVVRGADAVKAALAFSAARPQLYAERLARYCCDCRDEATLARLALKLIGAVGCGTPDALFLAMHTVDEHLKELHS